MLRSHRRTELPRLAARMETHAVIGSRLRVHVVRLAGIISEDRLVAPSFARRGHVSRPMATFILQGAARLDTPEGERWLEPGALALLPEKGAVLMRQDGADGFLCLNVEWEPGPLGERPHAFEAGSLPAVDAARLRAIAHAIAGDTAPEYACACDATASVLGIAAALGAPVRAAEASELAEPTDAGTQRLSRVLDRLLSDLGSQPMMVDIHEALGVSARTAHRMVDDFNRRYGFNATTWQETRTRRRIFAGTCMMTAPGARTETVARAVGYGSPAAFCRALARAGLPSPGAIADAVARAA